MDASDYLIILTPSRDGRLYNEITYKFVEVSILLKRRLMHLTLGGPGIECVRTRLVEDAVKKLTKERATFSRMIRVLWYDDDIKIKSSAEEIAAAIETADRKDWNLLGHYWGISNMEGKLHSTFVKFKRQGPAFHLETMERYTTRELEGMKPYHELPDTAGGMGFVYTWMDTKYRFHSDTDVYAGEDRWWFYENGLDFRLFPATLEHVKSIPL